MCLKYKWFLFPCFEEMVSGRWRNGLVLQINNCVLTGRTFRLYVSLSKMNVRERLYVPRHSFPHLSHIPECTAQFCVMYEKANISDATAVRHNQSVYVPGVSHRAASRSWHLMRYWLLLLAAEDFLQCFRNSHLLKWAWCGNTSWCKSVWYTCTI